MGKRINLLKVLRKFHIDQNPGWIPPSKITVIEKLSKKITNGTKAKKQAVNPEENQIIIEGCQKERFYGDGSIYRSGAS